MLRQAGLPTADEGAFAGAVDERARHRLLLALVQQDGWAWSAVSP